MDETSKRGCGLHFYRERIWSRGYLKVFTAPNYIYFSLFIDFP